MSAPTLPPGAKIMRLIASRAHDCASPWLCNGVAAGDPAGYVPTGSGTPVLMCAACCDHLESTLAAQNGQHPTAVVDAQPDASPEDESTLTPEQLASGQPGEPLCGCTRGPGSGFTNVGGREPGTQRWVHSRCGLPAYAGQPPAQPHHPDPTEVVDERSLAAAGQIVADGGLAGETDEHGWPVETAAPVPAPADRDDVVYVDEPAEGETDPVCECARITKRAKFTTRDDGVVVHAHCGRRARPEYQPAQTSTEESTTDDDTAVQSPGDAGTTAPAELGEQPRIATYAVPDDGPGFCRDADCPGPGICGRVHDHPAAGGQRGFLGAPGPADSAVVGGQAGSGRGGEAGEGALESGEDRDAAPGPGGLDRRDPSLGASAVSVPGGASGDPSVRHEGVPGGGSADVGAVGEAARGVAAGPDEVSSPGGLAAFYAQPTGEDHAQEDDPGATVAAFFAQPSEDDEPEHPDARNEREVTEYATGQTDVSPYGHVPEPSSKVPGFRRFYLDRDQDVTGVSGTGVVALGIAFPNGRAVVQWQGERPSTVVWDSVEDAEAIHGHGGATRIVWVDA